MKPLLAFLDRVASAASSSYLQAQRSASAGNTHINAVVYGRVATRVDSMVASVQQYYRLAQQADTLQEESEAARKNLDPTCNCADCNEARSTIIENKNELAELAAKGERLEPTLRQNITALQSDLTTLAIGLPH
jgi:hypothetical protein